MCMRACRVRRGWWKGTEVYQSEAPGGLDITPEARCRSSFRSIVYTICIYCHERELESADVSEHTKQRLKITKQKYPSGCTHNETLDIDS